MLSLITRRTYRVLKPAHFAAINDLAQGHAAAGHSMPGSRFLSALPLMQPDGTCSLVVHAAVLLVTVTNIVIFPLRAIDLDSHFCRAEIPVISIVVYALDMLATCNCALYKETHIEVARYEILKSQCGTLLLSALLILYSVFEGCSALVVFCFVKLVIVYRSCLTHNYYYQILLDRIGIWARPLYLLVGVVLLAHYLGALFLYLAIQDTPTAQRNSWLHQLQIESLQPQEQYLHAVVVVV